MIMAYNRLTSEKDKEWMKKMHQVEYLIAAILAVSSVLNLWLLIF